MQNLLETYRKSIFTIILVAILISFAIRAKTSDAIKTTTDTITSESNLKAVDQVYCILYDDGELSISQNKIEPQKAKTVIAEMFTDTPGSMDLINEDVYVPITSVVFNETVKPTSCYQWFYCFVNDISRR